MPLLLKTSVCARADMGLAPFSKLVRDWASADLEPQACASALQRRIDDGEIDPSWVDVSQIARGGVVGTDALLFPDANDEKWRWQIHTGAGSLELDIERDDVAAVAELVRITRSAQRAADAVERFREIVDDDGLVDVLSRAVVESSSHGQWRGMLRGPAIQRREHASLLVQTEGARLVTDPQLLAHKWTSDNGCYPNDVAHAFARVLVTHGHNDHWDLCSAIHWSRPEDQIVIPPTARRNVLSTDVANDLDAADQKYVAPSWYSQLELDGVRVQVLPFYGEQPSRSVKLREGLRNWGSCFRFDLDGWSFAILVDSGADAEGDMVDVLRRSVAEHGPIDVVMSCCLPFPEGLNFGLPMHALTLPFEEVRAAWRRRQPITNGPEGVARACEAAKARWFMAYAHGFAGLGRDPVPSSGSASTEAAIVREVRRELATRHVATEVIEWAPGDVLSFRDGQPEVTRA